jgi:hypothetical protein
MEGARARAHAGEREGVHALAPAVILVLALAWGLHSTVRASSPLQPEQDALQSYEEARQALGQGRLDEAELLLERVLMLMPEHAGARLEFALLLARRGQTDAARTLILGLAQDTRTPPDYRAQLLALAARLQAQPQAPLAAGPGLKPPADTAGTASPAAPPPTLWRAEAGLSASSNPLARTGAEGIVITLPDGPVTLPLNTRPQPATLAGGSLLALRGSAGLEVSTQQMDRRDTATAFRIAAWGPVPVPGPAGLQWQLQTQRGFDNLRRHSAALAAPSPLAAAQRVLLGAYAEPAQQERGWWLRLEHRFGLLGAGAAPGAVGAPWGQASLERSASTARAQGYWRLNLALELPLGPQRRLQAQASAQEDTHPYSPLLENNSRRRLLTHSVTLEQQWPLAHGAAVVLRVFHSQRHSNLALFAFQDAGAQLALARQW